MTWGSSLAQGSLDLLRYWHKNCPAEQGCLAHPRPLTCIFGNTPFRSNVVDRHDRRSSMRTVKRDSSVFTAKRPTPGGSLGSLPGLDSETKHFRAEGFTRPRAPLNVAAPMRLPVQNKRHSFGVLSTLANYPLLSIALTPAHCRWPGNVIANQQLGSTPVQARGILQRPEEQSRTCGCQSSSVEDQPQSMSYFEVDHVNMYDMCVFVCV